MKVLWLSHLIPFPPKGGVLQRSYNMIREASEQHDITLVAFNQRDFLSSTLPDESDPVSAARSGLSPFLDNMHIIDIPEYRVPFGKYWLALYSLLTGRAYNMEWLRSEQVRFSLSNLLKSYKFDVVHIDTISLCVYFDLFDGIPVVLNHHNFESEMLLNRSMSSEGWLKSLYFRIEASRLLRSEKQYCRSSSLNLTCSDDDSDMMVEKMEANNFLTVPNGVDTSYFYPNIDRERKAKGIVIVGGLSWYPNREAVQYFIREIWPVLRKEIPEVRVDVVGRDPTDEMLRVAASDDRLFFHGFVDDVRDYLWESDFYLCPIRTGGGTKLKILDALATGCCIVADPFSCKGILVQEDQEVLYAETPIDYVNQIKRLIGDPELQLKLRASGPKLIEAEYSYKKIGMIYSSSINKLANDRMASDCNGLHES